MRRWFKLCGLMFLAGALGMWLAPAYPPEILDAAGKPTGEISGEMPPAFAVSFAVLALGAAGAVAGCFVAAFRQK